MQTDEVIANLAISVTHFEMYFKMYFDIQNLEQKRIQKTLKRNQ